MKFGVVIFPGSNCDQDMIHVLEKVMHQEVTALWHKQQALDGFGAGDVVVLPGGFSYGDYLRPGAIARFSPLMESIIDFANHGGILIGICNGFQVLCEAGLLPGVLLRNSNQKFICKNTWLKVVNNNTRFTSGTAAGQVIKIPIAHADGRFFADEATLAEMQANHQILFQYCDAEGHVDEASNPNGALLNIAGICNKAGNVFGMMPHPERASEEALGNVDGLALFQSLLQAPVSA